MHRLVGIGFCLLVFGAASFAFSPRAAPPVGARPITVDKLLLLDATMAGARLLAVGERGHILYSDDRGTTWRSASSPTRATLTAMHMLDPRTGWAVGHDATILKTTDGGAHWRLLHQAPAWGKPLLAVRFVDAAHGFAIGAYGLFMASADGGETWRVRGIVDGDPHLNALTMTRDGPWFIAGEAGLLLRSDDQGQNWQRLPSPYRGSFFGLVSADPDAVLAFGLRGKIFRSTDHGANWQAVESGTQSALQGGGRWPDGRLWLAGQNGTILVSDDQGQHFQTHTLPTRRAIAAIVPGQSELLVFGESGMARLALH